MNGCECGTVSVIANILFVLLIASYLYNKLVEKIGNKAEGWVWLEVVIGVLATLAAIGVLDTLLDWNAFFLGLLAFSVSGAPMIVGAAKRFLDANQRAHKAMKEAH